MVGSIRYIESHRKILLFAACVLFCLFSYVHIFLIKSGIPQIALFAPFIVVLSLIDKRSGIIAVFGSMAVTYIFILHNDLGFEEFNIFFFITRGLLLLFIAYVVGTLRNMYFRQLELNGLLQKSERMYRNVVNGIREAMLIIDLEGNIRFINKETVRIFGFDSTRVADGMNLFQIAGETSQVLLGEELTKQKRGKASTFEADFRHPVKGLRRLLISAVPLIEGEGRITGSIAFCSDITEVTNKTAEAEVLYKKNLFLISEMQHRLRNNLSLIIALLRIYKNCDGVAPSENFEKVENLLQSISRVMDHYLNNFDTQVIDTSQIIHELSAEFMTCYGIDQNRMHIDIRGHELHIDQAMALGMIYTIVLSNVLKNLEGQGIPGDIQIACRVNAKRTLEIHLPNHNGMNYECIHQTGIEEKEILKALSEQMDATVQPASAKEPVIRISF